MMKKKLFLLFVLAGAMPLTMMAQDDDLYFVPSKKKAETTSSSVSNNQKSTYNVRSARDVDEYNRRGKYRSSFQTIGTDSLGNDIIEFHVGTGIYPDTTYVDTTWVMPQYDEIDDFTYSRQMSRWDGYYGWYDPWYFDRWGWHPLGYYSWYDPWYYPYYGWYGTWHDPWFYYGWYGPWNYNWRYGYIGWGYPYRYYGWNYPYYYGGGYGYAYTGTTGTHRHGRPSLSSAGVTRSRRLP